MSAISISIQMPMIQMRSNDGQTFVTDTESMICSRAIRGTLKLLNDGAQITVPHLDGATLGRVVCWAAHYRGDPKPAADAAARCETLPEWDAKLLDIGQHDMHQMIVAADSLGIPGLMHAVGLSVARQIKGKTSQELRAMFNITDDLSKYDWKYFYLLTKLSEGM